MRKKYAGWARNCLVLALILLLPCLVFSQDSRPLPATKGTIKGQVVVDQVNGAAVSGMVAFFEVREGLPSGPGAMHRVPNAFAKLDAQGFFSTDLPEGKYYVGIILGRSKATIGPPRASERSFTAHDPAGIPRVFAVESGKTVDAGLLSGKVPTGGPGPEGPSFIIRGIIRTEAGAPVPGAKVVAFKVGDPSRRPIVTSQSKDEDGSYLLKLPAEVSYNISVRVEYGGGQPAAGEYIGRYGDKEMAAITGKKDDILRNVDITVYMVPERSPQPAGPNSLRKRQPADPKARGRATEEGAE